MCDEYSDTQVSPATSIVLKIGKCDQHFSRNEHKLINPSYLSFFENAKRVPAIFEMSISVVGSACAEL